MRISDRPRPAVRWDSQTVLRAAEIREAHEGGLGGRARRSAAGKSATSTFTIPRACGVWLAAKRSGVRVPLGPPARCRVPPRPGSVHHHGNMPVGRRHSGGSARDIRAGEDEGGCLPPRTRSLRSCPEFPPRFGSEVAPNLHSAPALKAPRIPPTTEGERVIGDVARAGVVVSRAEAEDVLGRHLRARPAPRRSRSGSARRSVRRPGRSDPRPTRRRRRRGRPARGDPRLRAV